jgi:hypothetical protein
MEVGKMILGVQIFGVLFGLFMAYYTFLKFKKKEFNNLELIFWQLVWVIVILLVLFPYVLDFFVKGVLQMSRTLDFLIIVGFMFLFGLIFYTYSIVNKLQKRMERLIRNMALRSKK